MSKKRRISNSPETYQNILRILDGKKIETPTGIAKTLNCDSRTIKKSIRVLENLGVVSCTHVSTGKRKIKVCRISEQYSSVWNNLKKGKKNKDEI